MIDETSPPPEASSSGGPDSASSVLPSDEGGGTPVRTRLACDILRFLSGQLDDDLIVTARRWVAAGRVEDAVLSVVSAVLTSNARLHDTHVLAVATLLDVDEIVAALAETSATSLMETPLRQDVAPVHASAMHSRTIGELALVEAGIVCVCCALRRPPLKAPWPPPRVVWVVEAEPSADVARLTGAVQDALIDAGIALPIVEVRHVGEEPTSMERTVTEIGDIAWARHGDEAMRLAPVFDFGVDGRGGFDPAHPVLEPGECERLCAYLRAGTTLRFMGSDFTDVVAADAPGVVPIDLKTDGRWIWSDATRYYLERYGLAPAEPFLAHLRSIDAPRPGAIDSRTLRRAFEAIEG